MVSPTWLLLTPLTASPAGPDEGSREWSSAGRTSAAGLSALVASLLRVALLLARGLSSTPFVAPLTLTALLHLLLLGRAAGLGSL